MNSVILRTGAAFLLPLLIVVSFVILLRGHNEPGGGFVGGLTAAAGFLLYMLAFGVPATRRVLRVPPLALTAIGLGAALGSGLVAPFTSDPLFAARWTDAEIVEGVKIGTPLLFDIGVYFVVKGSVLLMVFTIAEREADAG
jgi:multicomponent Na+:H+ antiporter subunit B